MEKVELAVIINSYNRLYLLEKSLNSLVHVLNNLKVSSTVVVFDANSTDGSLEWIRDFIATHKAQSIHLIVASPGEPDSFSYGVNKACEYAMTTYPSLQYLFLYETDNFISSPEPLLKAINILEDKKELAACGFTVKKHTGNDAGLGASFPTLTSFVLGQQFSFFLKATRPKIHWEYGTTGVFSYADVVYTSPLLIRKNSWKKVGGFDAASFPFSDCDIDLAYRFRKAGEKMGVVKTEGVIHDNLEVKSSWSSRRTLNFYKARYTYFRKHYGKAVDCLKPLLFVMHTLEWGMLAGLCVIGKREIKSLKTRWALMKTVFRNYTMVKNS